MYIMKIMYTKCTKIIYYRQIKSQQFQKVKMGFMINVYYVLITNLRFTIKVKPVLFIQELWLNLDTC